MSGDRRLQDDRRPEDERQLEDRLRRFRVPVDPGGAWEAVEYRAQEEERAARESLPLTARVDERAGVWKRAFAPRMSGRRRTSGLRIAVFASLVVVLMAAATIGTLEAVEHFGRGTDILVFTDDINIGTATSTGTTPATVWEADGGIWQPVTVTVGGAPVRGLVIDPSDASVLYALTDQGLFKSTRRCCELGPTVRRSRSSDSRRSCLSVHALSRAPRTGSRRPVRTGCC